MSLVNEPISDGTASTRLSGISMTSCPIDSINLFVDVEGAVKSICDLPVKSMIVHSFSGDLTFDCFRLVVGVDVMSPANLSNTGDTLRRFVLFKMNGVRNVVSVAVSSNAVDFTIGRFNLLLTLGVSLSSHFFVCLALYTRTGCGLHLRCLQC